MKICVVGSGYVGLVTAGCLAEAGNRVTCVDVDEAKIRRLEAGSIPIYEPGLAEIVKHNLALDRLNFTTDFKVGVDNSLVIFLAVGTPSACDGSDPEAASAAAATLTGKIRIFPNGYDACENADAVVILTDWQEFRNPDFELIAKSLKNPVIFDGRNLYDPAVVAKAGIEYHCVGRPTIVCSS